MYRGYAGTSMIHSHPHFYRIGRSPVAGIMFNKCPAYYWPLLYLRSSGLAVPHSKLVVKKGTIEHGVLSKFLGQRDVIRKVRWLL
jgi:hypothetical protein